MRAISLSYRIFSALAFVAVVACGDPNTLPPVQFDNVVDTTELFALTGTGIGSPSGFDVVAAKPTRTDLNRAFDFAVDLAADGTLLIVPAGALGLPDEAGVLVSNQTFDGLTSAPLDDYVSDTVVAVATGDVVVLRSRNSGDLCSVGSSLPRYGKFHVLAVDAQTRAVTLEFLVNRNCGYRSLLPGTPED